MSDGSPERTDWTSPKEPGAEDSGMVSSLVAKDLKSCNVILDDLLDVPECAVVTALRAAVKRAEELNFDKTNVFAIFKRENYKIQMCVRINSQILRLLVCEFKTNAAPNLVCTCLLPLK